MITPCCVLTLAISLGASYCSVHRLVLIGWSYDVGEVSVGAHANGAASWCGRWGGLLATIFPTVKFVRLFKVRYVARLRG